MLALLQIQRWRANARNVSFRTIFRCLIHIINSFDKMTKFCCKSYYLEQHHSFLETYPFHSLGSNKFEWSNVRYVFIPDFVNFRKVRNTLCCFPINQLTSNTSQIERRFARDRTWKNDHSKWPLFLWRHCFHDKLFKYILFSFQFREGFRSVVVITSALHAEGRRFEPCRNQLFFFLCDIFLSLWKFEVFMAIFMLDYPFFGRLLLPNFVVFQCYSISFREKRPFEWFKKIC